MTLFVNCLVERACELLHWVDQDLVPLAIHFEALGQCLALPLNHAFARKDHVVEDLVMEDVHFASGLIVLLQDVLVGFVHLLVQVLLHRGLKRLDLVTSHPLQLLSLLLVHGSRQLSLPLDLVHLGHHLPTESVIELGQEGLHADFVQRERIL